MAQPAITPAFEQHQNDVDRLMGQAWALIMLLSVDGEQLESLSETTLSNSFWLLRDLMRQIETAQNKVFEEAKKLGAAS